MNTVYLSNTHPRVPLTTEADLQAAADVGLLEESHYLELKREIPGKGSNRETARDLASFAVDGGTIIVGVEELDSGHLQLSAQPLSGLPERLEQIAAMIPDPPLAIVSRSIASQADATLGYVIVHVPASPSAPHMVDGRYLGRGHKTKMYLSDAEVLRLHHQRVANEVSGLGPLDTEFGRDLFDDRDRGQAHLFLVAEPLTARADMMAHLTDIDAYQQPLLDLREKGRASALLATLKPVGAEAFSPGLDEMQTFDRRPNGVALSTYGIAAGRLRHAVGHYDAHEAAAELELSDGGGLRIYSSRLSAAVDGTQMLFDGAAVGLTRQLLALTEAVAEQGGYFGNWILALGATGLKGSYSYSLSTTWGGREGAPYGEDVYKRALVVSHAELTRHPGDRATARPAPAYLWKSATVHRRTNRSRRR